MKSGSVFLCGLICLVASATAATADSIYLVGAQIYASQSDGSTTSDYQFSTNSSTTHDFLDINGATTATPFALSLGTNSFTFAPSVSVPTNIVGISLFFSTTNASYNPAHNTSVQIPGDLAAYTVAGSSTFSIPVAGTPVESFNTSGTGFIPATYSGASVFQVGDEVVSIGSFTSSRLPAGSFTLDVAATPLPPALLGGIPLLAILLLPKFRSHHKLIA